jgi:transposase
MIRTTAAIGLDIAKSVFQVHGIDAAGEVIVRRQLSRARVLSLFEKLPHHGREEDTYARACARVMGF